MDQLFLVEVLVDNIHFNPSTGNLPFKRNIIISVSFGELVDLEIKFDGLAPIYSFPKGKYATFS